MYDQSNNIPEKVWAGIKEDFRGLAIWGYIPKDIGSHQFIHNVERQTPKTSHIVQGNWKVGDEFEMWMVEKCENCHIIHGLEHYIVGDIKEVCPICKGKQYKKLYQITPKLAVKEVQEIEIDSDGKEMTVTLDGGFEGCTFGKTKRYVEDLAQSCGYTLEQFFDKYKTDLKAKLITWI